MAKGVKTGHVCISNNVVSAIAGTACYEVEGVFDTSGNLAGELIEKFGKKNLKKGVSVFIENKKITIGLNLIVKTGYKVQKVAEEVQEAVKNAVEKMTGLSVESVNISVIDIQPDKAAMELETENTEK